MYNNPPMLIRKLQLKDVKNYEEHEFDFETGVTAICGPNGAGKTTIIEAIAWALFDHLDYKREDFVRKGSRKGSVNVSFISKLDGRDYTIYRDTSGTYYAYDPVMQVRIAQQKQDVIKWLCLQHGVEPGTDLSILFRTTIGVPQGTFTFDFLQPPSKRKPIFDKILKVEEYIKAADELKELIRLIERRISTIREQIASYEGELKRYDELLVEHTQAKDRLAELKLQCEESELEKKVAEVKVAQFDNLKSKIDRLTNQQQTVELNIIQKREREKSLSGELARAERAQELVVASQSGYQRYQEANTQLQALERDRARRDQLRASCISAEQQQARLEVELKHHRESLAQIEQARVELDALAPRLLEQERIEQQLRELQRKIGEKEQVTRTISKLERELEDLRDKYSETSKSVDEAEKHKNAADLVARLQNEQRELEEKRRSSTLALTEIKHKEEQLANATAAYEKCQQDHDMLAERVARLRRETEWDGPELPQLEAEYQQANDQAARCRAEISRDEQMLREVKDGLCPLLAQRCLNMKEGQTLDLHFSSQLNEVRAQLATSEVALTKLSTRLTRAREVFNKRTMLDTLIGQLDRLAIDQSSRRIQRDQLKRELQALGSNAELVMIGRNTQERLSAIESELPSARDGMIKYAQLEPRRQRLEELKREGIQRRDTSTAEKARLKLLNEELMAMPELESQLVRLGNPRATIESLRRQVAREAQYREELKDREDKYQQLLSEIAGVKAELAEWVDLDNELLRVNTLLNESRVDYDTYISNRDRATQLPGLQKELEVLQIDLIAITQEQERIKTELTSVSANYSAGDHTNARTRLEELIRRAAQLESEYKYTEAKEAELKTQLDALSEVRKRQADKIAKRDRLGELEELASFIRECLRRAGPHITEAYIHTISLEANQLYREISGNSLVSLRWDPEYEIILEEEGRDRPFNNLSGGEQMAAALSVRMALLKEFSDLRFAFFDEPTTNMDEERRRNLAQQIGRIKDFEQLFVVSHDDSFEGFTDRIIQLEKVRKKKA